MLLDESERPKSLRKDGQRRTISDRRKERAAEKPEGSENDVGSQHPASGPRLYLIEFQIEIEKEEGDEGSKRQKRQKQKASRTPHPSQASQASQHSRQRLPEPRPRDGPFQFGVRRLISYGEYKCCVLFFEFSPSVSVCAGTKRLGLS